MWNWSLDWDEITEHIVIGTCPMDGSDLDTVVGETGVTAVLSLQHPDDLEYWNIDLDELREVADRLELAFRRCPIRDFDIDHMRERLPEAVNRLAKLRNADHRVYVHCTAGRGRAPLTTLAYLVLVEGYGREEAIQRLLNARPEVVPSWEAFEGSVRDLTERYRSEIEERAYDLYEAGVNDTARADWFQACREVLRDRLGGE